MKTKRHFLTAGLILGAVASAAAANQALEVWHQRISPTTTALRDVCYGNGSFVAVGVGGIIATSTNGVGWTQATSGTSDWLSGVTYANGMFVAVGSTNILT